MVIQRLSQKLNPEKNLVAIPKACKTYRGGRFDWLVKQIPLAQQVLDQLEELALPVKIRMSLSEAHSLDISLTQEQNLHEKE